MKRINILPKHLTELIAAGEVVERPASVVKELLENSIDAGALSVTLEIKNGGVTYIRVTDNGGGIPRDDISAAFISHATSKLSSEEQLNAITSLGFRGEALASIAAVSRVTLLTRTADEEIGSCGIIEGGGELEIRDAGCPEGTTITVGDLFYNTPARLKFLKKDATEGNAVASVAQRIALSHPEVSFRFIKDNRQVFFTPGDSLLYSAIYTVLGKEFADGLIEVSGEHNGIDVTGFVCKPQCARPNKNMQFFFINGRLVKSATCIAALTEAYKNSIMTGKQPSCVLSLTIDASLVDVNVHPSKTEVRFENERDVFEAVMYAVKNTLNKGNTTMALKFPEDRTVIPYPETDDRTPVFTSALPFKKTTKDFFIKTDSEGFREAYTIPFDLEPMKQDKNVPETSRSVRIEKPEISIKPEIEQNDDSPLHDAIRVFNEPQFDRDREEPASSEVAEPAPEKERDRPIPKNEGFSLVGEAFGVYLIISRGDTLIFIDKHAAHERMIFNELKQGTDMNSQYLMEPIVVSVTPLEHEALMDNTEILENAGFCIDDFGDTDIRVRAVPMLLLEEDAASMITEIADKLLKNKTDVLPDRRDELLHTIACRAAVKSGDAMSDYEKRKFVDKLLSMPEIKFCPHGRPIYINISKYDLEKQFKRKI